MWILDDGPFGALAQVVRATAHWDLGVLHVTEAVAVAAQTDQSGRRTRLLDQRSHGTSVITVHSIARDTEAWQMIFSHLRRKYADATADFGEHEAIALCACTLKRHVFVTQDKAAALLALSELGPGRVASSFDVWEDLYARGFVDSAERDALRQQTLKRDGRSPGVPWRLRSMPLED